MATTDRSTDAAPTASLAEALQQADFLVILGATDGGSAATAGLLADAANATATPYQVCLRPTPAAAAQRAETVDDGDTVLAIGHPLERADRHLSSASGPVEAFQAAAELGGDPSTTLALAGSVAAGGDPTDAPSVLSTHQEAGYRREPGVGAPVTDPIDALAFGTLLHGPFSGSRDRAASVLEDLGDDPDGRTVATAATLAVAGAEEGPTSVTGPLRRALNPLGAPDPYGSVEGFADLLTALASADPGAAVELAIGEPDVSAHTETWRAHGRAVHEAVRDAGLARYDGVVETQTEAAVGEVARLLRDARAPEPASIVLGEDRIALATTERDAHAWLAEAAESDRTAGHEHVATARTDTPTAIADALREVR